MARRSDDPGPARGGAGESSSSVAPRGRPSLARDAVVAALDPRSGKVWNGAPFVVPAALLVELAAEGRLQVSGEGTSVRVGVRDPSPLGDELLDEALLTIAAGTFGDKVSRLAAFLPGISDVLGRLVAEGAVTQTSTRVLGVIPAKRYALTVAAGREVLAARLEDALTSDTRPDARTAMLLAVLSVGVHLKLFVPRGSVGRAYERSAAVVDDLDAVTRGLVDAVKLARERDEGGYTSAT